MSGLTLLGRDLARIQPQVQREGVSSGATKSPDGSTFNLVVGKVSQN